MPIRLNLLGKEKVVDPPPPPEFADLDSALPSADSPGVAPGALVRLRDTLLRAPESPSASREVRKVVGLCQQLLSERGEVSGGRLAADTMSAFRSLNGAEKRAFFDHLAGAFSPDPEAVGQAGLEYRNNPTPENLSRLQRVVEPLRRELFRRLNLAPGATAMLVEMRRLVLEGLRDNSSWKSIADDLEHLFMAWFNRGFLVLERIDWRTPAIVLEKLIRYEAVHEIQGWHDLRRRLAADRRCYAFFHPALPEDPIIFIEVALTRGISAAVQPLLDPKSPILDVASADTAIFYSITNCQEGLRGVPFGSFLIKQVVEDLSKTLPRVRKYATLSPVPGFRAWLERNRHLFPHFAGQMDSERVLLQLCAHYLLHAKYGGEPLDPVARFHLKNGARLERLNWMGDSSEAGVERSFGIMVNYVYKLNDVERNHEQYTREYRIATVYDVESLAKKAVPGPRAVVR